MNSYLDLLEDILRNGESHNDRTGVGTTSLFGYQWRHRMSNGFPLLTTKKMPLRWVFEELKWFLSGSTDVKDLQARGVDIWDEWATVEQCARFNRLEGDLGPVYGALWRSYFGCDQIQILLHDIITNPNSRRLIVTGWHPLASREVALPPCHTLFQFKCHGGDPHVGGGELSLHLYARSIDAFLGLPFNIASYALLLKMIGHVTNRRPRDLIISFGDVHIYNNHKEQCELQISRITRQLPLVHFKSDTPKNLDNIEWSHIEVTGYDPHPAIKAEVAV